MPKAAIKGFLKQLSKVSTTEGERRDLLCKIHLYGRPADYSKGISCCKYIDEKKYLKQLKIQEKYNKKINKIIKKKYREQDRLLALKDLEIFMQSTDPNAIPPKPPVQELESESESDKELLPDKTIEPECDNEECKTVPETVPEELKSNKYGTFFIVFLTLKGLCKSLLDPNPIAPILIWFNCSGVAKLIMFCNNKLNVPSPPPATNSRYP